MRTHDTIAAIATSLTPAGIGIIRLSGDLAFEITDRIFRGKRKIRDAQSHSINYGFIVDPACADEAVDQVLVMKMCAPRSYTGENVSEIQCHGGTLMMKRILQLAIDNGAYPAEPGEFTKRAFLNGKIDLSQAEAVADVIDAQSRSALKVGLTQLRGGLSKEIKEMRAVILRETAFIEAALDDPEHYSLDGYGNELEKKASPIKKRLEKLISDSETGRILKSGIDTVILGKPNAGKSSIYNLLTGAEKAIVTDIAGTTRDTLTENIVLGGVRLNITDTAGLRESDDEIEKIGVLRAKSAAENAELLIIVIEIGSRLDAKDLKILDFTRGKPQIVLLNKRDIFSGDTDEIIRKTQNIVPTAKIIPFSAKTGEGLDCLSQCISEMFVQGKLELNDDIYVTSVRHVNALRTALLSVNNVLDGIKAGVSEELLSVDLTDALNALGSITGETAGDEIIDEIFSKFCMGK